MPNEHAPPGANQPGQAGARHRVHLVVRAGLPATAGNLVTAHRLAATLAAHGLDCRVLPASALVSEPPPLPEDIVHALHARGAGLPALGWAQASPVVWTFTGTDLAAEDLTALSEAAPRVAAFIAFHPEAAEQVRRALPLAADRMHVIAPGVALAPAHPSPVAAPAGLIFLLPAGIRPVKDPDLAVAAVAAVARQGLPVHLFIAGPARDPAFHQEFLRRTAALPFVHHLGEVERDVLAGWYAKSDVVLNTSRIEGLSNAVLEAMAAGRAVLAADIPGNRAAIRHGVDGWLASPDDLPAAAVLLARDRGLRERLGATARATTAQRFSPEAEALAYRKVYEEVCGKAYNGGVR